MSMKSKLRLMGIVIYLRFDGARHDYAIRTTTATPRAAADENPKP